MGNSRKPRALAQYQPDYPKGQHWKRTILYHSNHLKGEPMCKFLMMFFGLWVSFQSVGQVLVINELDCDTPGFDDKEFIELRSFSASLPLDGYVIVFFNGSAAGGNASYMALDLDGYTTDINGIFLIGSNTLSPFPHYLIPPNVIQNGEDAVAIYQADAEDFPVGTLAYVDATLVDVMVYGTNDPDATILLDIFKAFNPAITQLNEGPGNNTTSIQRNNDGTFFTGVPTPRKLNDGSGIPLNGLHMSIIKNIYEEGESMEITFITDTLVSDTLFLNFSLYRGNKHYTDYTGDTTLFIVPGKLLEYATINFLKDDVNDGDIDLTLRLQNLPPNFVTLNNNIPLRILDIDFEVASFGTPIQPTYGVVSSTQPPGYYDGLVGLSGATLYDSIQALIANPDLVRAQTYNDVISILKEADQNPKNNNQIWLVYLEQGRSKNDFQITSNNIGTWNREHTLPRSRGGFFSIDADTLSDGKEIYWTTNADSLRHANSDAHGIRAVDGQENSSRGNKFYGQYSGPVGTQGGFRGDVARSAFFLATRYNGLELVPGYPEGMVGQFGHLDTLLAWHRLDKPDDFEMNRNNVVYTWQFNRNPFIDMPELVEYLWGSQVGNPWPGTTSFEQTTFPAIHLFPNPAKNTIQISGLDGLASVEIYTVHGQLVRTQEVTGSTPVIIPSAGGIYLLHIHYQGQLFVQKLQVEE